MPKTKPKQKKRTEYDRGFEHAAKAYGGCEICYGKGYSTQGHAGRVQIHPCSCGRGKALDELLLKVQAREASVIV